MKHLRRSCFFLKLSTSERNLICSILFWNLPHRRQLVLCVGTLDGTQPSNETLQSIPIFLLWKSPFIDLLQTHGTHWSLMHRRWLVVAVHSTHVLRSYKSSFGVFQNNVKEYLDIPVVPQPLRPPQQKLTMVFTEYVSHDVLEVQVRCTQTGRWCRTNCTTCAYRFRYLLFPYLVLHHCPN